MGIGGLILQEKNMAAANCDVVYDCEVKRNPDKTVVENIIDTYDYPIKTLELNYFCASKRNGFTYRFCKKLFSVTDVERNFGYGKHGWVQFKDYEYAVKFKGRKYTDAESLIPAFANELVPLKYTKKSMIKNEMFASEFGEELKKIADQNKFKPILTLDETKKFLKLIDTDKWFDIHRNFHVDIDTAQKAIDEVNQTMVPEESDELSHMNDADILIMYGTLLKKQDELIEEMLAARDNALEIRRKLSTAETIWAQKEKQVEDNKEMITKLKQKLSSNQFLIIQEKKEEDNSKEEIERLRAEIKSLQDKVGEGDNFKTAEMFPNKSKYFKEDPNKQLGKSLSTLAWHEKIKINKVRSGAYDVGNYPISLHNKITEWLENKVVNEFTANLQPLLKPEYRGGLNV